VVVYVDSSAFVTRYLHEGRADAVVAAMPEEQRWMTARLTGIEVLRTLHRRLGDTDYDDAVRAFTRDWERTEVIAQDEGVADFATEVALEFGVRTLDAIHLASAWQAGERETTFLTFDRRQAAAARELEFDVVGVG
jgi:predicted nucleic acid-binding protein